MRKSSDFMESLLDIKSRSKEPILVKQSKASINSMVVKFDQFKAINSSDKTCYKSVLRYLIVTTMVWFTLGKLFKVFSDGTFTWTQVVKRRHFSTHKHGQSQIVMMIS